jgi:hypothetical protein
MPGWLTARFPKFSQDRLLLVVDLIGTFVFAVEGALAGIDAGLDVFGLLVLSFVTALGGGTIRDLLIGAIPPNSIRDWRYGGDRIFWRRGSVFLSSSVSAGAGAFDDYAGCCGAGFICGGRCWEGVGVWDYSSAGDHDGSGDRRRRRDGAGCAAGAGAGSVALRCVCGGGAGGSDGGGDWVEVEDAAWSGDEFGCGGLFCASDGRGLASLESAEGDDALKDRE